jgi:transcriptional regulator with XRE-family HTH domain
MEAQTPRVGRMPGPESTRSLSPDESERVRAEVRKLVTRLGTQAHVAEATGLSQQQISLMLKPGAMIGVQSARKVATYLGATFDDMLSGSEAAPREPALRTVAGFDAAVAEARQRYRHIPPEMWDTLAEVKTAKAPPRITAAFLYGMANSWLEAMSSVDAEGAEIQREMAAHRKKNEGE